MSDPGALIDRLLERRGIGAQNREAFLRPDFQRDLHAPEAMKGMEAAVSRILLAREQAERILVFGDYDADGVPATALLLRVFRSLDMIVDGMIPKRSEGYGLTPEAVERITAAGCQLLITVDNGTVSKAEIARLAELGIETIICDHHEPQVEHMARPLALINPKQPGCQYPFKELCACGLAWKLCQALYGRLGLDIQPLKWELDLVALSTVADMVPLVGENRVLVQFGLQVLRMTKNLGLRELGQAAGIKMSECDETDIGFRLAPRLNAPSRLHQELYGGANASLALLIANDRERARELAVYLNRCNASRQDLVSEHLAAAQEQIERQAGEPCLVLYDPGWSTGVIGLVAGRLTETYGRPTVVLAPEGGQIKGSVRSVDGVHVVELLASAEIQLERYGGHAKAGGLTLKGRELADVERLRESLQSWLGQRAAAPAEPLAEADLDVPLADADLDMAERLRELAPFGIGFPEPVFSSLAMVGAARSIGQGGKHLSCLLEDGTVRRRAVGFGLGALLPLGSGTYRGRYSLQAETWQGERRLTCMLKGLDLV